MRHVTKEIAGTVQSIQVRLFRRERTMIFAGPIATTKASMTNTMTRTGILVFFTTGKLPFAPFSSGNDCQYLAEPRAASIMVLIADGFRPDTFAFSNAKHFPRPTLKHWPPSNVMFAAGRHGPGTSPPPTITRFPPHSA